MDGPFKIPKPVARAAAGTSADEEFCDVETWETLSKCLREVQLMLDRNRLLIQLVNDNHRSKLPQNMAKNVELICEMDSNLSKAAALYSNLSADFTAIVRQRRSKADGKRPVS